MQMAGAIQLIPKGTTIEIAFNASPKNTRGPRSEDRSPQAQGAFLLFLFSSYAYYQDASTGAISNIGTARKGNFAGAQSPMKNGSSGRSKNQGISEMRCTWPQRNDFATSPVTRDRMKN